MQNIGIKDCFFSPMSLPVLWMDDQPKTIMRYREILELEASELAIDPAVTIKEARNLLHRKDYCAVIIDCQMDPDDEEENGARFLLEINGYNKCLPTFVSSAFLRDPLYTGPLERSYAVLKESKTKKIASPLSGNRFFRAVADEGARYWALRDIHPEEVSYEKYREKPLNYSEIVERHWQKHKIWISKELDIREWNWCIVCGSSIVDGSGDLFDFPDESRLEEIGRDMHLIPFSYTRDFYPEEPLNCIGWGETEMRGDWYPRMRLDVDGNTVEDDFDTGAIVTHLSSELIGKSWSNFFRESNGEHLGRRYRYFPKKICVTMVDRFGRRDSSAVTVHVVDEWSKSPFVLINKARRALIGRDILRAFDIRVVLDASQRITCVELVEDSDEFIERNLEGRDVWK